MTFTVRNISFNHGHYKKLPDILSILPVKDTHTHYLINLGITGIISIRKLLIATLFSNSPQILLPFYQFYSILLYEPYSAEYQKFNPSTTDISIRT